MLDYRKEILPNGVRIVTEEIPYIRSVAIGIWVGVGSRDEDEHNNGVSHFIEHLLFKGTKNRTAKQIAEALEAVGGQLNAFTTKEYTCYYARALDEHFDLAVDILSDIFFNSLFDPKVIDTERNVILEEIHMYEDSPDELIHDLFAQVIWQGHPLGRPILGTMATVSSLTHADIINYFQKHYVPEDVVIAVAGRVEHAAVMDKLSPVFGAWERERVPKNAEAPVARATTVMSEKKTEQIQICLGTPGVAQTDDRLYILHVLNNVLGGGVSSRLFQEIREERGLAYSVYSYHSAYRDSGLFSIYAGTSPNNMEMVLELIMEEISKIKREGITQAEIERTKNQIKGNLYLGLENVNSRMSRLGKSELCYGRIISPDEVIAKIEKVTADDLINLAREMFNVNKFALATIGPKRETPADMSFWLNKAGL